MSSKQIKIDPTKVKGLGELIDGSDEDFKEHFKDKDLGYLLGVSKLLNLSYEQMTCMVNDLVIEKEREEDDEKVNTIIAHIKALYYNMGLLEHKAILLKKEIGERQSRPI